MHRAPLPFAALLLLLGPVRSADDATDAAARTALEQCRAVLETAESPARREEAVYALHDVRHPDVVESLGRMLLASPHREVRNVAAMALGGQGPGELVGTALAAGYKKHFKDRIVLSSVLDAWLESGNTAYWPRLRRTLRDRRTSVAIRAILLLEKNRDTRALPDLLDMYLVLAPERPPKSGKGKHSGRAAASESVDASRESAKQTARARARADRIRNYEQYIRRYLKAVTRVAFDNPFDAYEWYGFNYAAVERRNAVLNGTDPDRAVLRAQKEQPKVRRRIAAKLASASPGG